MRFDVGECGVDIAKAPQRFVEGCMGDTVLVCDLSPRDALATPFDVRKLVTPLFQGRSPAAIAGLISLRPIDAIKGAACGCFAHVGKKRFKRFAPSSADLDTARPISEVRVISGDMATPTDCLPRTVGLRARIAMSTARVACSLSLQATAALRASVQLVARHNDWRPAIAFATPVHPTPFRRGGLRHIAGNDKQAAISVASSIDKRAHVAGALA